MYNSKKQIAIIGAGPGGLTLARILQQAGFEPLIYERESSPTERSQGGTLDLETHTGQKALQVAGLMKKFEKVCRYEGQALRIMNKYGNLWYENDFQNNEDYSRPEIDRADLRNLLLNSLHPNSVQWGYRLIQAVPLSKNQYELQFEHGEKITVDLVIAADGAFSRIRSLVSQSSAKYSGISMIELSIKNVSNQHADILKFNGSGSMFAMGDNKTLMAQVNGDNRIRVYLGFRMGYNFLDECDITFHEPEIAKKELLKYFDDWSGDLKKYILYANGEIIPRRIYMLPVHHRWEHKPGVTLIGDAAHLMSPFAGAGANLAMLDGTELALSIINHSNLEDAIKIYEEKMFAYAGKMAAITQANLDMFFSDRADEKLEEFFHNIQQ
ncbi:NAD(P)/FAD-dependent oxidoreductase [Bacillus thuringiensis]|uniref:FAD-dependent oxidoreductase n=1 Tax=Bacillus thuringiensis TaxID=1428 RepID=UPI000A39B1B2|nr:NAD(P)/FAD-dependent oxidoreductase [Bacillus thuringiensis]MED3351887.1 NAD(P)/FAD-dependent oxidoreductase [Bacillus thuringiensis]MRB12375.1 NAD(P)-binding protein [Bacillus thuringiensis]OTX09195.1 tetracycline resistance protein [Bacillus thuringiensis serovar fukuokaensis]